MSRDHVLKIAPTFLLVVRSLQLATAVAILGLAAYGETYLSFDGDGLILFTVCIPPTGPPNCLTNIERPSRQLLLRSTSLFLAQRHQCRIITGPYSASISSPSSSGSSPFPSSPPKSPLSISSLPPPQPIPIAHCTSMESATRTSAVLALPSASSVSTHIVMPWLQRRLLAVWNCKCA
jgi:hypothetical protein